MFLVCIYGGGGGDRISYSYLKWISFFLSFIELRNFGFLVFIDHSFIDSIHFICQHLLLIFISESLMLMMMMMMETLIIHFNYWADKFFFFFFIQQQQQQKKHQQWEPLGHTHTHTLQMNHVMCYSNEKTKNTNWMEIVQTHTKKNGKKIGLNRPKKTLLMWCIEISLFVERNKKKEINSSWI